MNIILKRSLAFFLSFMIVFSSTSALAASPAGWATSPADIVINGAQATITALKGKGSSALKSVIVHAPSPATVGKTLLKGAGAAALLFAVTQKLGDGVDWILDPVNNSVVYTDPTQLGGSAGLGTGRYLYVSSVSTKKTYSTPESACDYLKIVNNGAGIANASFSHIGAESSRTLCYYSWNGSDKDWSWSDRINNPDFVAGTVGNGGGKKVSIPVGGAAGLAQDVINNAAAGNAPSQDAIRLAAMDSVNTGALDSEFEASAVPNVGTTNPDGTVTNPDGTVTNPDGTVTNPDGTVVPPKPFDPSSIISAIQSLGGIISDRFTAITTAIGLTNDKLGDMAVADAATADAAADAAADAKAATDAKAKRDAEFDEWAKAEPTPLDPDTALDIDVPNILPVDTDINFGGSCPANFEVNSSIFGNPINIVLLDTSKFCGFLSTFVKFPVYAVSSLFALYILGGRKDV